MRFDPLLDDLNKRFPRRSPEPPVSKILLRGVILFVLLWLLLAILICFASTECHAQTISPAISEAHGPKVRGEFTVTNNQIIPMAVWIEPQSVSGGGGQIFFKHLDSSVSVRFTSTSARLSPKQSYSIGFEVQCAMLPCIVNLAATFTGLHSNGLAVALHTANIVYICQREKHCRDEIRASWGVK